MKLFSLLEIGLFIQQTFAYSNRPLRQNSMVYQNAPPVVTLNRAARYGEKIDHNDAALIRLMEDVSTFYELFLSGAKTRSDVNIFLKNRDPHFSELDERQYNILLDKWLYEMIGGTCC